MGAMTELLDAARNAERDSARDHALAHAAADELRALAEGDRAAVAPRVAQLTSLGSAAAPLLALYIEDDALRPARGDEAVLLWLSLDRPACVANALAWVDEWQPETLLALLRDVDETEVYELIAPRYRRDRALRLQLAAAPALTGDPRFADLAREVLASDGFAATLLLATGAAAGGLDELIGIIDNAERLDDNVVDAVFALEQTLQPKRFLEVLQKLLAMPWASQLDSSSLGLVIAMNSRELRPLLEDNPRALAMLEECVEVNPGLANRL